MKIKFYLSRPHSTQETAIMVSVSWDKQRYRFHVGESINPKYWNPKKHRAKNGGGFPEAPEFNLRLDGIQSDINAAYINYENENKAAPSISTFRQIINTRLERTKEIKLSFLEYFQEFINRTNTGQRRDIKGRIIKPSKAYAVTLNTLKDFNAQWNKNLDFDTADRDFYKDYLEYLQKKKLAENTIGRDIKHIKAVLNDATENGVNTTLAFRRFAKPSEDVDNIALTEKELQDILHLDLSDSPHLDRVRDLFLIACHTGLRYSDFSKLTADNIKGGFIEVAKQEKTGQPVTIPVHSVVKAIIKKYSGDLPESVSNQKMNDYLKDVCKQVESLKQPATKTTTKGGTKVTVRYEKWEIVTTHTGRRTFATNAYRQGIPTITIMAITGHKTEVAFLKYIKINPKEHAAIMAEHWAKRDRMKVV